MYWKWETLYTETELRASPFLHNELSRYNSSAAAQAQWPCENFHYNKTNTWCAELTLRNLRHIESILLEHLIDHCILTLNKHVCD